MGLNETPRANRLHIGIFGKRNVGKSALINALTGQETALVAPVAGTTTDPVYKAMEIHPLGPCVLIDTAGFDDEGVVGKLRVERTREAARNTEIALIVFDGASEISLEKHWIAEFKLNGVPTIAVLNKADLLPNPCAISTVIEEHTGLKPIIVSSRTKEGIEKVLAALVRHLPADHDVPTLTGGLVEDGDLVLLVMPQDLQAPKGRLILPQVQTIRELLDRKCLVVSVTIDRLEDALRTLARPPAVIITDSQVFQAVYEKKPPESKLTSFSVLFAGYKGDLAYFVPSVTTIDRLTETSKVLIAEACAHVPLTEDIGREKIPRLLRQKVGEKLAVEHVRGMDFPADLSSYDLIIHCGACMFNRKYVLSRVEQAKRQGVPMTNYGIVLAYFAGILDQISL